MTTAFRIALPGLLACLAAACGEGAEFDSGGSIPPPGQPECLSSNECPTGWTCSEFLVCQPPPEMDPDGGVEPPAELEYDIGEPVSSQRYVFVAMTDLDALARIDGVTRAVDSVHVGEQPRVVAAAPGSNTAVVLDSINGSATVVRPTSIANERTTLATLPHLNQIRVAPGGHYAVAWFDLQKAISEAGGLDGVGAIGSFQDVTVVALRPGEIGAVDLAVGFRPRDVVFDDAGTHAHVITEEGISIIDLAQVIANGPTLSPPIPITSDPLVDPAAIEVQVTATGAYAVVREDDAAALRVVKLTAPGVGTSWQIPLPATPSDVDLARDGQHAYAVLRDTGELAIVDIPGDAIDPTGVELVSLGNVVVGSLVLSDDGQRGALFTNAALREEITVVDLGAADHPVATFALQKSVRTARFDPTGSKLLVINAKVFGDPGQAGSFEELIDRSYGYSIVDVASGFAKLQITPVDPGALAFAPAAPRAYILLDGGDAEGAVAEVQTIALDTGVVRSLALGSPPDAIGVLPEAGNVFVSQRHPLGRMTFIDIAGGQARTITGFDLESRIVD